MSQQVLQQKPMIARVGGLDQSITPTAPVTNLVFFTNGLLERNGQVEKLAGKVAMKKFGNNCFDICFLPNGKGAYFHVKGTGLVYWDEEELIANV